LIRDRMMFRMAALAAIVACFGLALGSVSRAAGPQGPPVARPRSVWDGVYTMQQARRGEEQYDAFCQPCHGSDLQGDGADAPGLVTERFAKKWDRHTLKELFTAINQTMPATRPGTLSQQAYSDVLAYILQANGFPTGAMELGHVPEDLARIRFEEVAPGPR
jgi:mono/diheme cytochrome c family protein